MRCLDGYFEEDVLFTYDTLEGVYIKKVRKKSSYFFFTYVAIFTKT